MLLKSQSAGNTEVVIDRETHSIVLTRTLSASRAQAFDAWTRPEQVTCWWDPAGRPLSKCEIDLRPGGAFRFVVEQASGAHQFAGIYREITPPDRLVFEAMGAIGRVSFEETGGKTLLTVRIECSSASHLDNYLKAGIDTGTARTIDNLAAYLDPKQASSGA
jgi:uncharacterized protein YndB with AHSA1/START domain